MIILPLDMTNHLALIKTSDVTNIAGVSSRSKNRGAMRSVRYERFWAVLAIVGGEAACASAPLLRAVMPWMIPFASVT